VAAATSAATTPAEITTAAESIAALMATSAGEAGGVAAGWLAQLPLSG